MNKSQQKFAKEILFLFLVLTALALVGGAVLHTLTPHFPSKNEPAALDTPQKIENQDQNGDEEKVDENSAKVRVSLNIKLIPKGRTGRLIVENLPMNKTGLKFSLSTEGGNTPFFYSTMILPGYGIYEVPLNQSNLQNGDRVKITLEYYGLPKENKITESSRELTVQVVKK